MDELEGPLNPPIQDPHGNYIPGAHVRPLMREGRIRNQGEGTRSKEPRRWNQDQGIKESRARNQESRARNQESRVRYVTQATHTSKRHQLSYPTRVRAIKHFPQRTTPSFHWMVSCCVYIQTGCIYVTLMQELIQHHLLTPRFERTV